MQDKAGPWLQIEGLARLGIVEWRERKDTTCITIFVPKYEIFGNFRGKLENTSLVIIYLDTEIWDGGGVQVAEWVRLNSWLESVSVLARFFNSWCQRKPPPA